MQIPHPIPYQGSKRKLSSAIATFVQPNVRTLYEPFAGSAAFTLYAAKHNLASRFVIGDVLEPLIELWNLIVNSPTHVSDKYQTLWEGQKAGDLEYYYRIRDEYNQVQDPVMLLYLITRCVKNAVRFSKTGKFTQSVDKRRLGQHPAKMRASVFRTSELLVGKVDFYTGDFEQCLQNAESSDLVYLDPPYQGISDGRDKRYYRQLSANRLYGVLQNLNERNVPYLLSYDGMHGEKEYGSDLPPYLDAQKILLNAGRSSQATLSGRNVITLEALYMPNR